MVLKERLTGEITQLHRIAMRRIAARVLENAYHDLLLGGDEWDVCVRLGVDPEVFEGVLQSAIEEALWERGHVVVR
jgi:hypothetical protein